MHKGSLIKDFIGALGLGFVLIMAAAFPGGTGYSIGPLPDEALAADASKPTVTISPTPVEYKRKVKVTISGTGFQPKQQLGLLVDMGGVTSDISGLVKPEPVTNEKGEFSSVWVIDREIRGKLLTPTSHTIEVTDEDLKTLAKGTLVFQKPEKTKK